MAAEVEEVLALSAVAGLVSLMLNQVREAVLYGRPSSQFGPALGRFLPGPQLDQEGLVIMDGDAAPALAPGALHSQRAALAG